MAAAGNPCTSPGSTMQCGAAKRARKVLATIAFSYLGVSVGLAVLWVAIKVPASSPQAVASSLRTVAEASLRLPVFCVVPLVAINALLTAEIVVEMLRFGARWARLWSDKRHLVVVLAVWIALLSGQLGFVLVARQRLIGG